jgi:hypothetical protein
MESVDERKTGRTGSTNAAKQNRESPNVSQSQTVARKCWKHGIPIPERVHLIKLYWARVKSLERNEKKKR